MKLKISYKVDPKDQPEKCIACAGSGYYDMLDRKGRSIKCSSCEGTGYEDKVAR